MDGSRLQSAGFRNRGGLSRVIEIDLAIPKKPKSATGGRLRRRCPLRWLARRCCRGARRETRHRDAELSQQPYIR